MVKKADDGSAFNQQSEKSLSELLYLSRLDAAPPGKRGNLEVFWRALNEIALDPSGVLSISKVGQRSFELGGVKAQSIRNKNGAVYREIFEAFCRDKGVSGKAVSLTKPTSQIDAWIDQISDIAVRTILKMEREEARRCKAENDMLRQNFRKLQVDPTSESVNSSADLLNAPRQIPALHSVTLGVAAIREFLADDWLEQRAWRIQLDGSILDETTDWLVAPPGFADALREALNSPE